jgi:hypothetical protein
MVDETFYFYSSVGHLSEMLCNFSGVPPRIRLVSIIAFMGGGIYLRFVGDLSSHTCPIKIEVMMSLCDQRNNRPDQAETDRPTDRPTNAKRELSRCRVDGRCSIIA